MRSRTMGSTETPSRRVESGRAQISASMSPACIAPIRAPIGPRSEEHTSELQSLMRISYAVFCLKKKKKITKPSQPRQTYHQTNNSKIQSTAEERENTQDK